MDLVDSPWGVFLGDHGECGPTYVKGYLCVQGLSLEI